MHEVLLFQQIHPMIDVFIICHSSISASMHLCTMLNRFLIGLKSGDLAGITCIFDPIKYTNTSKAVLNLDDLQLYYSFASYLDQ